MGDAQITHTLNYLQPQKMEDDLKNVRRPQNGRQHKKWKMTSKMEDNLKNGRRPQKWKTT